jgi:uncharacterized membrane protein
MPPWLAENNPPSILAIMKRFLSIMSNPGMLGRVSLVLAAMCALYLSAISLAQTPMLGCGEGSSCYSVLASRWAFLFGIPASFIAIAIYLVTVLAAGAFEAREQRTWIGLVGEICVILITVAAVWFLYVQFFSIKQFCAWCCLTHLLALLGVFALTLQRRSHPQPDETRQDWAEATVLRRHSIMGMTRVGAVIAGIVALGIGPFFGTPEHPLAISSTPGTNLPTPGNSAVGPPLLGFAQGKIVFSPTELPLIGNGNAKEFAAVLTDYTCDYCRQYSLVLEELVKTRGPDFAIALLPAARDDNGALIQHTMLCLFKADPAKHATLSQQLIVGTHPANAEAVRLSAETLLGQDSWKSAEKAHTAWATQQIMSARKLHQANHEFTNSNRLPQLLLGNQILVGFYDKVERLNTFVETTLHPTPGATAEIAKLNDSSDETSQQPEPTIAPSLQPRLNVMDLGLFEPGQSRSCEVEFTNPSPSAIKISWIGLDRGCELVKMPRDSIPPKGRGAITVKVLAPEATEHFQRQINIHSDGAKPLVVQVQGRVGPANPAAKPAGASTKATVNRR